MQLHHKTTDDIKSLVIIYDNGVKNGFPDTDDDKLNTEGPVG